VASDVFHDIATVVEVITAPAAGEAIARKGGVVSTVMETESAAELPAASNARTSTEWTPSARPPRVWDLVPAGRVAARTPSTRISK
jgi:hypothetical protein